MFSRFMFRKTTQLKTLAGSVRLTSTNPPSTPPPSTPPKEGAERDLVNFPRPVRQELPGKIRYGFVPEEWFDFMYKKTGVTGPYCLGFGVWIYLVSKEVWVIEHDFYYIYAFFGCIYVLHRTIGKDLAAYLDKQVDLCESEAKADRAATIKHLEEAIKAEEKAQWQSDGQIMLIEAKRVNVNVQLDATYRERAMEVYQEVKKRLDFQVEKHRIDQLIAHKHMVQWVVSNVLKSISEEQEKQNIKKCIDELQALANKV